MMLHPIKDMKTTLKTLLGAFLVIWMAGCTQSSQFGDLIQGAFSLTPKCAINERLFNFQNTTGKTLNMRGAVMAPGTNGAGHYSIRGFKVGSEAEIPADAAGGISPLEIPAGAAYSIRIRYSPLEESGDSIHTAIVDMSFNGEKSGIIQIELYGQSEGEEDCPEVATGGGTVSLSGDVDLTITFMVVSTGGLGVPMSTNMGVDPFAPVTLEGNIATNGDFSFPQITSADNFFLPPPDPSVPALGPVLSIISGETHITSRSAVTGTFNADTKELSLPSLVVDLADNNSTLVLDMPFTTGAVDSLDVPNDRLLGGGFTLISGQVVGLPVQDDGTVHLVGTTLVTEGSGPLSAAVGLDIAVRIEAQILCKGETDTVCDGE